MTVLAPAPAVAGPDAAVAAHLHGVLAFFGSDLQLYWAETVPVG